MSAQDFLVELGTEELPPKALNTLAEAFLAGIDRNRPSPVIQQSAATPEPRRRSSLHQRWPRCPLPAFVLPRSFNQSPFRRLP